MTLTCAIIDDEPLAISLLESYVNKTPFLRLTAKFNSALEALPVLSAQPVELLFLDIQMPELSGMEFSRILEADTRIIFTTAFEQYALDSYKVNALDFIKTEYKQVQVELRKILYIEGLKDYVKIFIEDEPHPILSLMSMKSLEEMLPASHFIRVHRSFIVQPEKIKVIERNRIVFGKEYIPISDNYKPRLVEFLAQRSLNFN